MPYTRPDRKGLPDTPPENEDLELRRSDSYLHLSDASAEQSSPSPQATLPQRNETSSPPPPLVHTHNHPPLDPPELTPLIELSRENTPTKPSTPRSGSFQRRLSAGTPTRRPSSSLMGSSSSLAQPVVDPAQAVGNSSRSPGSQSPPNVRVERATVSSLQVALIS